MVPHQHCATQLPRLLLFGTGCGRAAHLVTARRKHEFEIDFAFRYSGIGLLAWKNVNQIPHGEFARTGSPPGAFGGKGGSAVPVPIIRAEATDGMAGGLH
ncbi:hypothetical protein F4774DRAFT_366127 [Daldinia eschscholtzii]|nr:hypothetical protein F4774DRAFT_366127 [Daldinia eschscholtzii]